MKLIELLEDTRCRVLQGGEDIEIKSIEYDSRRVGAGAVFVCITGFQTDGHRYAAAAADKGASAVICEHMPEGIEGRDITVVQVENSRIALAEISAKFYYRPSEKMCVIGITGTNGKTTTTYLIKSVLDRMGKKVGVIGTIENRIGERVLKTERTTPESKELQELFAQMADEKVSHGVMEVSSHSLDLHRVDGVRFKIGVFTNLTQDHLDYHKTMESYKTAKAKLFERAESCVINTDDEAGEYMAAIAVKRGVPLMTYGTGESCALKAENISVSSEGTEFTVLWNKKNYAFHLNTPGRFSVYNALGAIGACLLMDIPMEDIVSGLRDNKGVTGRFQTVRNKKGFQAVVDYAHTPDGLENVLKTAREFTKGRLVTVFGCGGDRDKTKRPIMGEIAGKYSDMCIITSDNPRTEDPLAILDEIEEGMKKTPCLYEMLPDRGEAIIRGTSLLKKGDVLVIAGKGHETYQIFKDKTIHFDDIEEVRKAFGDDCI